MSPDRAHATAREVEVRTLRVGAGRRGGELARVAGATGTTVIVQGSGSSRHSPRNRFVTEVLQRYGQSTLLLDLLSDAEAADRARVFDIDLLSRRLVEALSWLQAMREDPDHWPVGLFGASTSAAAALRVAAQHPQRVAAVVSRGGRPDLVGVDLARVQAPTLLIVGGEDTEVLALNRVALRSLRCRKRLEVVPGATSLFEQPGALETVAHLAGHWLAQGSGRGL
jgi:putative phosphoribosyl transferase